MTIQTAIQTELTQAEIASMEHLTNQLETLGLRYKLDLNTFNTRNKHLRFILCTDGARLTGFAILSSFDAVTLEVVIIIEPNNKTFTAIDATLKEYVLNNQMATTMYIISKQDVFLQGCLDEKQCTYFFSEYRMIFDFDQLVVANGSQLKIEKAVLSEAKMIAELEGASAHNDEEQSLGVEEAIHKIIVAKNNNEIVAAMRIEKEEKCYAIYGFVVKKERRGQGIGRYFLAKILQEILKRKPEKIYLEVSTENISALCLYQSSGFQIETQFDYYLA